MATKTYTDQTAPPVRPNPLAEDTRTGIVRRESWVALSSFVAVDAGDAVHRWLMRYSITALHIIRGAVILDSRDIHVVTNNG